MHELVFGSQQQLAEELAEYMGIKIYLSKEFLLPETTKHDEIFITLMGIMKKPSFVTG